MRANRIRKPTAAVVLGLMALAAPANAAVIDVDVTFEAREFTGRIFGDTAPHDPVSGSFSFSFDQDMIPDSGLYLVDDFAPTAFSLVIDGFTHDETNTLLDLHFFSGDLNAIVAGGVAAGNQTCCSNDDFGLVLGPRR